MVDGGGLAAHPAETVYEHVDRCPTCAKLIAEQGTPDTALSPTLPAEAGTADESGSAGIRPQIGRYEVQDVLGAGGMGVVYAAWDPELRRRVALKLVRSDRAVRDSSQQLLREARALARISHPNVVTAHDVGEHDGEVFVATELVAGETLATWHIGRSPGEIVAAWIQAARGLAAAHTEGVVHRDVKPSNVLVGADGRVRIGDFGLARESALTDSGVSTAPRPVRPAVPRGGVNPTVPGSGDDASIGHVVITATGFFGGTPGYMAPEHEHGKAADARSDQFSLCVSIAETLTESRPRADARLEVQPPALAAALERGLRSDPSARFPSVAALADALAAAIAPRRRRWPLAIAVVGAAGVLTIGTALASRAVTARGEGEECQVVEVPPDLWPVSRRAAVAQALAPGVAAHIDAWLANWSAAAAGVCAPGRASPEIQSRQRECLSRQLTGLRKHLDAWAAAPPPDPMQALSELEEIGLPSRCSQRAIAATADPPSNRRAEVDEIRDELAGLKPDDGSPAALAKVTQLVTRARRLGYPPLIVEALETQAGLHAMTDQAAARRVLREAVAAAGRDRYSRILTSLQLLSVLGADLASDATSLAEQTRAELAALGGDPALEAQLDYYLGAIWSARNDPDQAIAAYERSRRGFRAAFGPGNLYEAVALYAQAGATMGRDGARSKGRELMKESGAMYERGGVFIPVPAEADDPAQIIATTEILLAQAMALRPNSQLVFSSECSLADALTVQGNEPRALEHYLRAIELGERLGVRDARLAGALTQSASIAAELGRPAEGVGYSRRALVLAEELGAEAAIGTALTVLGSTLLQTGQRAEAQTHLARALRLREKLREPGRFRGRTRYLLATALGPRDRKRARELAYAARVDIQADIDSLPQDGTAASHVRAEQTARLAEIDAWLRAHR